MPVAYRIARARYAADAFSGEGARLYGGRWNSPGIRMVYTSGSISLCTLEMLVHLGETRVLSGYVLFRVHLDNSVIATADRPVLPANWRDYPAPGALAAIGDRWVRSGESVALKVPSAVIESESNFLLNPGHPAFQAVEIEGPFPHDFDARLT
jgi:RES domain-containing protein